MGPIASATARSGIATIGVAALFIVAYFALEHPGDVHRLSSALRAATHTTTLTTAAIGWLACAAWLWMEGRKPPRAHSGRLLRVGWAVLSTLLISLGIVVLLESVQFILHRSGMWYWGIPWRYWLRLLEASLFAVVIVRLALPLILRHDRIPFRNA